VRDESDYFNDSRQQMKGNNIMSDSTFNRVQLDTNSTEERPSASEYFGTVNGEPAEGGFNTTAAIAKAMEDKRYKEDSEYRKAVQGLVSKTSDDVFSGPRENVDARAAENAEIVVDTVTAMMSDPRYRTSAAYRREVERRLAASMPHNVKVENTGTADQQVHRVIVKTF
jgi:hypothetical protein